MENKMETIGILVVSTGLNSSPLRKLGLDLAS